MNTTALLVLALALSGTSPQPAWHVDFGRFFPDAATESTQRTELFAQVDAFAARPTSAVATPQALLAWLRDRDALDIALHRHETFVYLKSEADRDDHADADADAAIGASDARFEAAVHRQLAALGHERLAAWMAQDPALARYRHFIDEALAQPDDAAADRADALLAQPALDGLQQAYRNLHVRMRAEERAVHDPDPKDLAARPAAYAAVWAIEQHHEDELAAVLLPIVRVRDGLARLRGQPGAPEEAYRNDELGAAQVRATLQAVAGSQAFAHYAAVRIDATARQMQVAPGQVKAWDYNYGVGTQEPRLGFDQAVERIRAAVQPMGPEYAGQFTRLLDPAAGRVEWCRDAHCDDDGFSTRYAGQDSTLFYGDFDGSTDTVRATAHEAAHAVHGQFMREHQPIAAYNAGPKFMFESFAIFNQMLLFDQLRRDAGCDALRAAYLDDMLQDATRQVFSSAREATLEAAIYDGVRAGRVHGAKELDALALQAAETYLPPVQRMPERRFGWDNRLYFTDPLYDVNYLFAGLLALNYLQHFEADPEGFRKHYVALLENGFDDTPQALLQRFLGIDLNDAVGLVKAADREMDARSKVLAKLYAASAAEGTCTAR